MGIILTTINTFFGIINTILSIVNTLFMLINILFIGGLIFAVVYLGPKIKSIFDGFTALQTLSSKLTQQSGDNKPPCLTENELNDFKNKINDAKLNIDQLKNLPFIGKLLPDITGSIDEAINNIKNIPICQ